MADSASATPGIVFARLVLLLMSRLVAATLLEEHLCASFEK